MRQSKTLILSTNVDKKIVSGRVLGCNLSPDYGSRKHCYRRSYADPGGGPTLTTFFKLMREKRGSKYHNKRATNDLSAKRHMAFRWRADGGPTLNAGLVHL